jgi:O-methyltransferase
MAISKYIFHELQGLFSKKGIYLTKSLSYRSIPQVLPPNFDYVRYATLGLCYEEIIKKGVKGAVAEVGVFQGDFAKRLNQLFSDRKLYLFDTFEGFSESDVALEKRNGYSTGAQDFSATSVELVKSKMVRPELCVFKKGYFPESAAGLEDIFCFVSLDADLYEPIYQGLVYFYPRLQSGGYIFVHDFNNEEYKGARQAVMQYCQEQGISYTPIADGGGTAVLSK